MAVRENQNAVDEVDEAVCRRLGVNRTDGRCMDILERTGRMTAGQLAAASGLTTGAVTTVLDRLERAGYVSRIRDTVDRRRVLVELTHEARRHAWEAYGPLAEGGRTLVERFSDEELIHVRDFFRDGTAFLLEQAARIRALAPLAEAGLDDRIPTAPRHELS